MTEVNDTIKGHEVIESATMEEIHEVISATEAGVTEINATVIKYQQGIESVTMEGSDEVTSVTEASVKEFKATVIKGQQVI
ncbi:hypothetical protein DPMN_060186 [Dreissena polymorpha]|uniref:Uncharacterized protein n=1 Tax=Dreissena polymorpha TaxID=45954 RepID=A0A9D4C553_DREPO|nr:hypothetical protein DPMN_060186 [Dreissena polymorpha]